MLQDSLQIMLLIPRGMEAAIYAICAVLIYNRVKKAGPESGALLSKVFFASFITWTVYMINDMFLRVLITLGIPDNIFDSLDFTGKESITLSAKTSDYIGLHIANFMRDIQLLCAAVTIILVFFAVFIIKFGTEVAIRKFKRPAMVAFLIFLIAVAVFQITEDTPIVILYPDRTVVVKNNWDSIGILNWLIYFLYLGVMFYAVLVILKLYLVNKKNLPPVSAKKLLMFVSGYMFYTLGLLYWIVTPLIQVAIGIPIDDFVRNFIGHSIWMLSPIFLYMALGLGPKQSSDEKEGSES